MESSGAIPLGAAQQLRKMANVFRKAEPTAVKQFANCIKHLLNIDMFLPKPQPPGFERQHQDLLSKPVCVLTADQERKQRLEFKLGFDGC